MTDLVDTVTSWPSLLLVLLVFGFAPGFCLRIIVLAYPRGDPRRAELIAELYAVPRIERPLWVTEQLEVALFEGLPHRISAAPRWFARWHRALVQDDGRLLSRVLFGGVCLTALGFGAVPALTAELGGLPGGVLRVLGFVLSVLGAGLVMLGFVLSVGRGLRYQWREHRDEWRELREEWRDEWRELRDAWKEHRDTKQPGPW
jgi:hypothetical protein